jgi:hypothetical protein
MPSAFSSQACIGLDGVTMRAPATNSAVQNNLFYTPAGGHSTVVNNGAGNTVTNNTASPTSNPAFTNASGSFSFISDFKPTANYSGATSVPAWYDALGVFWSTVWELGAMHN